MLVDDLPNSSVGNWVPVPATKNHDICDVLVVDGVSCGHIESFGNSVYAYTFGVRLGAYDSVSGARLEVEECAVRAMPLIRWLALREHLA